MWESFSDEWIEVKDVCSLDFAKNIYARIFKYKLIIE